MNTYYIIMQHPIMFICTIIFNLSWKITLFHFKPIKLFIIFKTETYFQRRSLIFEYFSIYI